MGDRCTKITIDLDEEDHGRPGFTRRDPEGHVLGCGGFDAWASR